MASWTLTEQQQQELLELARGWGKIIARRAGGGDGPPPASDFSALEGVAFLVGQGLTQGTLETLLAQQADHLPPEVRCPDCGTPCAVRREPRLIRVRGGTEVTYDEPVGHCPPCRRDFFPPAVAVAAGQPRL
jgi:hypothetical protein